MIIEFTKPFKNYRTGVTASIKDKMAEKLVEAGFANEVTLESTAIAPKKK